MFRKSSLATLLALFSIHAAAQVAIEASGTIDLQWVAPTQNIDGSPLTDLVGYKAYWGDTSRQYVDSVDVDAEGQNATIHVTLTQTGQTAVFAAMTAINSLGQESEYSNEVTKTVTLTVNVPPGAPENVQMQFTVDGCVVLNVPGAVCEVTIN